MIFIKNCTKELENRDVTLELTEKGTKVNFDIIVKRGTDESETFNIVTSELEGINESMVKAFDYIGNATNYLYEHSNEDGAKVKDVPLLDNKPTEVGFYVAGVKTVLKSTDVLPATIEKYEEESETNHYPRDMVVFILPNKVGDETVDYKLVVDRRNLGAPTMTSVGKNYTVLIMYVKWTIWSKLKFPAYAYIEPKFEDGREVEPLIAFKLGFTSNKTIKRNQIIFVDNKEAKEYLIESFRILREKRENRNKENGGYKSNKYKQNNRENDNNRRHYKSNGFNGKDKKYRNNKVYK